MRKRSVNFSKKMSRTKRCFRRFKINKGKGTLKTKAKAKGDKSRPNILELISRGQRLSQKRRLTSKLEAVGAL